jgi:hypothetical protein
VKSAAVRVLVIGWLLMVAAAGTMKQQTRSFSNLFEFSEIQEMSQNFAGQFSKTTLNFSCHQSAQ